MFPSRYESSSSSSPSSITTNESLFCSAIHEMVCWPQTEAGHVVNISCAHLTYHGVDSTKLVSRSCLPTGKWGFFNLAGCFHPDVVALMDQSYSGKNNQEKETFQRIIRAIRYIELVGLSISLISVLLSLTIFFCFKSLYCSRTKIHINLLLAILIQIIARLATYGIQMFQLNRPLKTKCEDNGVFLLPRSVSIFDMICTWVIIGLQFGKTAMFMWMLCEGIHLNNVLTVSVFKNHLKTFYFYLLGWILPLGLTLSWSVVMALKEPNRRCFNNYMHLKYYWIIDGPRYAVMIINVIFLLNIIRVLLVKMKEGPEQRIRDERRRGSNNAKYVSHFVSISKAVKAAIFLLPLLGILHVLETFVSPNNQPIILFAIYSSVTYLLLTLQGFFCSLLYCFLNAEVRETLARRITTTQIWYRWRRYVGKKDRHKNGTAPNDIRPVSNHQINHSFSSKRSPMELEEIRLTTDPDQTAESHL